MQAFGWDMRFFGHLNRNTLPRQNLRAPRRSPRRDRSPARPTCMHVRVNAHIVCAAGWRRGASTKRRVGHACASASYSKLHMHPAHGSCRCGMRQHHANRRSARPLLTYTSTETSGGILTLAVFAFGNADNLEEHMYTQHQMLAMHLHTYALRF